jgi:hypothetical protein
MFRRNPGALNLPLRWVNKSACGGVLTCFRANHNSFFSVAARTASKAGFKRTN